MIKQHTFPTPWRVPVIGYYREGTDDGGSLISCLEQDEYKLRIHGMRQGYTGIDLGAHIGSATLAMLSLGMKTYSIELIPENFNLLEENIKINNFQDRSVIYCKSISNKTGNIEVGYYTSDNTEHGKIHKYVGSTIPQSRATSLFTEGRSFYSETISLEDIFIENNIERCHFLKVDCEGAEWKTFEDVPHEILQRIDIVSGELHTLDKNKIVSHGDLLPLLKDEFIDITEIYDKQYSNPGEITHFIYKNKNLQ